MLRQVKGKNLALHFKVPVISSKSMDNESQQSGCTC